MRWRPSRPAVWAAAVLLLAAFFCDGACGYNVTANDLPADLLNPIRESAARRQAGIKFVQASLPILRHYFQSFEQMGALGANKAFGREAFGARLLANISCTLYWRRGHPPNGQYYRDIAYWSCAEICKIVDLDWSFDKAVTLYRLLRARGLWTDTPAVLWVGQDSWSVVDADALSQVWDRGRHYLNSCYGTPLYKVGPLQAAAHAVRAVKNLLVYKGFEAKRVLRALASMARTPSGLGVERLHLSMDDNHLQGKGPTKVPAELTPQGRFLPHANFVKFTAMLMGSPLLRELSISWDASEATSDTVRNVEAVAAVLAKKSSVRQFSIIRACSGSPTLADPLAALTSAASDRGDWRSVETFYYTVYRCSTNNVRNETFSADLEALQSLVRRMPALQRVHLAYSHRADNAELFPTASHIKRLAPDRVAVTVSNNLHGFVGVSGAATLTHLRNTPSDGYAVVVSAPSDHFWLESLAVQLELLGNKIPPKITALTVLASGVMGVVRDDVIQRARNPWPAKFAEMVPNLERLAIDSRWTGQRNANDYLKELPDAIAAKLRALMVHTFEMYDEDQGPTGFEDLLRILEAGRDISVVELGFSTWRPIYRADGVRIERLAATMSRMPRLENVTLTFVTLGYWHFEAAILPCPPDVHVGTLCDIFRHLMRFERATVVCRAVHRPEDHELRVRHHFPVWSGLSLRVPPTPAFASPWNFYNFW